MVLGMPGVFAILVPASHDGTNEIWLARMNLVNLLTQGPQGSQHSRQQQMSQTNTMTLHVQC